MAHKEGVEADALLKGEHVVFINKKRNRLKMLSSDAMLTFLKMPDNRPIDLSVVSTLPNYFQGGTLNYNGAVKRVLEGALIRKIQGKKK